VFLFTITGELNGHPVQQGDFTEVGIKVGTGWVSKTAPLPIAGMENRAI
jgi:hypothetical protein